MEMNYLKDSIFDLLNEHSEELEIADIETNEKENTFSLFMADGSNFEMKCRKLPDKEVEWVKENGLYMRGTGIIIPMYLKLYCRGNGCGS